MKGRSLLFSNYSVATSEKRKSIGMAIPKTTFTIKLSINWNKQARHVKPQYGGTHNNLENRTKSFINGGERQANKLFKKYCGKGEALGQNKERVVLDRPIGMYYNRQTSRFEKSNTIIIHYSGTGSHIVVGAPQSKKK